MESTTTGYTGVIWGYMGFGVLEFRGLEFWGLRTGLRIWDFKF